MEERQERRREEVAVGFLGDQSKRLVVGSNISSKAADALQHFLYHLTLNTLLGYLLLNGLWFVERVSHKICDNCEKRARNSSDNSPSAPQHCQSESIMEAH